MSNYKYTFEQNELVLLNHKNIISSLGQDNIEYNAIPSEALFETVVNELIMVDTNLSTDLLSVDNKVNTISTNLSTDIDTLSTNLINDIDTLHTNLSNDINALSTNLSNDIISLSTALSNDNDALNTKVNVISSNLSNEIESLSTLVSNNINTLETNISAAANANFIAYDSFDFRYDETTHQLCITYDNLHSDEHPNNVIAVDVNKFIAARIFRSVEVVTNATDNVKYLRLYFGDDTEYIDIPINELFNEYVAGTGIELTNVENGILKIDVKNYDILTANVNLAAINISHVSTDVSVLSSNTQKNRADIEILHAYATELSTTNGVIQTITNDITDLQNTDNNIETNITNIQTHVDSIQDYVNELSTNNGIIETLSNEIETLTNTDEHIDTNLNTVSSNVIAIKGYVNELSTNNGIIETLSTDIAQIRHDSRHDVKVIGHLVSIDTNPNVAQLTTSFEDLLTHYNLGESGLQNGSLITVTLTTISGIYTTSDGLSLCNGDVILIHDHRDKELIQLNELTVAGQNVNVYVLHTDISRNEYEIFKNYIEVKTNIISSSLCAEVISLSTALYNDIDTLSANLSNDIINLSTALSGEIDNLSTALSGEIDTLNNTLTGLISSTSAETLLSANDYTDDLSIALTSEINNLSSTVSSDYATILYVDNKVEEILQQLTALIDTI